MNIALVLSGGTGTRLGGDIPKQYIEVCGKPIIAYCLETLEKNPMISCIQIVAEENFRGIIKPTPKLRGFSEAGRTRQLSVLNGLEDIMKYSDKNDYVLIHDAARPLVSSETVTECLEAAHKCDGAMPSLPMKDTVYLSDDGKRIAALSDRSRIFAGQAPEAFVLGKYYEANKALLPDEILAVNGSAEPAVMAGMSIAMIKGDENNFKITTREDLKRFESICTVWGK